MACSKKTPDQKKGKHRLYFTLLFCIAGALLFTAGILIGRCTISKIVLPYIRNIEQSTSTSWLIHQRIDPGKIGNYLRQFTSYPHLGGTDGARRLADDIFNIWNDFGLDSVRKVSYNDVLVSYPNTEDPNYIALYDENKTEVFKSSLFDNVSSIDMTDITPPYLAFSPNRTAIAKRIVYANYGTAADFQYLAAMNISAEGAVVISRYGKISSIGMVLNAVAVGAAGVILYIDSADYTHEGELFFPDSLWVPPGTARRQNVRRYIGDILTPGYAAKGYAYQEDPGLYNSTPPIPCHTIGYGDAEFILRNIGGPEAPTDWQGGIDTTYRLGPELANSQWSVEVHIGTQSQRQNATNVTGFLKGSTEPDRYVILGSHHDAWTFGASDPNSGTAMMTELARVFAVLKNETGWRPHRSIIFCSWDLEELGLVGSNEWVEEFSTILSNRGVAFINVDALVGGNHSMFAMATPMLKSVLYEAAKQVESGWQQGKTLYEEWRETFPDANDPNFPRLDSLGRDSDHASFVLHLGLPAAWYYYTFKPDFMPGLFPSYHTVIDVFDGFVKYYDPGFKNTAAMAKFTTEILLQLADSAIIPYDVEAFADLIITYAANFDLYYGWLVRPYGLDVDLLITVCHEFQLECEKFTDQKKTLGNSTLEIRAYNDALIQLEKYFIDPRYVKGSAPSTAEVWTVIQPNTGTFHRFVELLNGIDKNSDPETIEAAIDNTKRHLAAVIQIIKTATASLKPVEFSLA